MRATPLRILAATLALLILALGAAAWFAGTEPVLRWLAAQAAARSQGTLELGEVRGSLYGPVRIDRLVFEDPDRRVEAAGLRLDWSPAALIRKRLVIGELHADRLEVQTKTVSEEPPQLPPDLRLPLAFELRRATVAALAFSQPGARFDLAELRFKLVSEGEIWRLALERLDSPWGTLAGKLRLDGRAPFALDGEAGLSGALEDRPYRLQAKISGELAKLALDASFEGNGASARAEALLAPFERGIVRRLEAAAKEIDPARWRAGAPQADLRLELSAAPGADGRLAGALKLTNSLPGPLDRDLLPVAGVEAGFAGDPARWTLSEVLLDLGRAGKFTGTGSVDGDKARLELTTRSLDLAGLQTTLRPTRLAGSIGLAADEEGQTLLAELADRGYRIRVDARHGAGTVALRQAQLRAGTGELSLAGTLSLEGTREFSASGKLARFNPAALGDFPQAAINAGLTATGSLGPPWQAKLDFTVRDSRLRGYPLAGGGRLSASAERVSDADVALDAAGNRLRLRGAFGKAGDRLDWTLDAQHLARLGGGFGGRLQGSGRVEGSPEAPAASFRLAGEGVRLPGEHAIARLAAEGRLEQGLQGRLALQATLAGYRSGDMELKQARLDGEGTLAAHRFQLAAQGPALDLDAALAGGWREGAGWSGELTRLENRGRYPLSLQAPARLRVAADSFALSGAALTLSGGSLRVDEIAKDGPRLTTKGELARFPVAYLLALAQRQDEIDATLTLGGRWDMVMDAGLDGGMVLWREQGDLTVRTDPPLPLGLSRLELRVQAAAGAVSASLDAAGARIGTLAAAAQSPLTRRGEAWGLAGDSPFTLAANAEMPSLAWVGAWSRQNVVVDGAASVRISASGTIADPRWAGSLEGRNLQLRMIEHGVNLKDGQLTAELQGQRLALREFTIRGGEGSFRAGGNLGLAGTERGLALDWRADRLAVLSRPDRHLVVSGAGALALDEKRLQLTGKLRADEGLFELPRTTGPVVSSDVVVVGRTEAEKKPAATMPVRLDLELDMGEKLRLRGRGLDVRLAGGLRLTAREGRPLAGFGSIRVAEGTYMAYGQRLAIERGVVSFSGPLDNPGLDVLAMRKNQPVEAGVLLTGTLAAPRARLVSNPEVPDTEKLSWLVLGHGLSEGGRTDFSVLQAAAGALLAQGESLGLQGQIARATGLDEVSVRGGSGLESTVLTLGKRISSNVYLAYEQGLAGAANVVKIQYQLSRRWSLRAQAGAESAVDVFYTLAFD